VGTVTWTALLEIRLHRAAGADKGQGDAEAARFEGSAVGRLLAELDDSGRRAAARWFHDRLCRRTQDVVAARAVSALAAMPLAWTAEEAAALVRRATGADACVWYRTLPVLELPLAAVESLDAEELPPLRDLLVALNRAARRTSGPAGGRRAVAGRAQALLPPREGDTSGLPGSVLDEDDAYGPRMRAEHAALLASPGAAALLAHCMTLDKPRPAKKWRALAARSLAQAPEGPALVRALLEGFVGQPEHRVIVSDGHSGHARVLGLAGAANTSLVRGLLWVLADLPGDDAVPLAGACALWAGVGLGGSGGMSRSTVVATAAVAVLAACDGERGEQAVRALAALRGKVRNRAVLTAAERAQTEIAVRAGLTPAQLRERSVPSAGLDARRVREVPLAGGCTAVLAVGADTTASLTFRTSSGRVVKTAPKAVREQQPDELKSLRAALKELRGLLSAERSRLEECLAAGVQWSGADWQRFYADHPVTGAPAGALLWEARAADGDGWTAGLPERGAAGWALAGPDGTAAPVGPDDRVRLWHPLLADPEDVRRWRAEVTARELRQPFKQVYREVYLLTPAEEATATYSNRFAAHILRFPQARSLMAARGWSAGHLGYWDGGYEGEAVRTLPPQDGSAWRARFYYGLVERPGEDFYVSLCSTDQVRFERQPAGRGAWRAADLVEVPPLVLSEALRDVDLFVGVASIATDPAWQDGGENRHTDYWMRTAFGELPASAEVRKEALARLLPRTRIADRAELSGRFLRVHGELGTYRIHLGSGNVLMEPNDAYLCIVVARGGVSDDAAGPHGPAGPGRVFLPFEEDGGMLAVVLSKAFLLADDAAITDPSITRQLPRRPATAA
jgi:hypothetical protein